MMKILITHLNLIIPYIIIFLYKVFISKKERDRPKNGIYISKFNIKEYVPASLIINIVNKLLNIERKMRQKIF